MSQTPHDLQFELAKARQDTEDYACKRIEQWLGKHPRQPAETAFTAGPMRNLARAIEDALLAAANPLQTAVLASMSWLGAEAFATSIREDIIERTGKAVSIGALYTILNWLEDRGTITSTEVGPTNIRGGRTKKLYRLAVGP